MPEGVLAPHSGAQPAECIKQHDRARWLQPSCPVFISADPATTNNVILKSSARCAERLEGWKQARCLRPSFETLARLRLARPQDDAGVCCSNLSRGLLGGRPVAPDRGAAHVARLLGVAECACAVHGLAIVPD